MLRAFALVVAGFLIMPFPAVAQKGQQVFDLFLQGAQQQLNRQQQREYERQQRQQLNQLHQQFVSQWHACHAGDLSACSAALSYPHANFNDRQALINKRAAIVAEQQAAADRAHLLRIEAENEERRQRAKVAGFERRDTDARLLTASQMQEQQNGASSLTSLFGFAIAAVALTLGVFGAGVLLRSAGLLDRLPLAWAALVAGVRPKEAPREETAAPAPDAPAAEVDASSAQPAAAEKPRDTAGAIAALELALAYIEEVREADTPAPDDKDTRKQHLNTLSLATKQLDLAQKLDPDAILEGQLSDVLPYRFSGNELKAEALVLEGMTRQVYDIRRAIPALTAATTFDPNNARAFFVLGLVHAANRNKKDALAAFERAVALDPKNIKYRKELNRVENLSAAEIAGYRATRAGEKAFDAAVTSWNVFAVVWNIATFPIRVVVGIFRFFRLAGFH